MKATIGVKDYRFVTIGAVLWLYRAELGRLGLREQRELTGLSLRTLSRVRSGATNLSLTTITRLYDALPEQMKIEMMEGWNR